MQQPPPWGQGYGPPAHPHHPQHSYPQHGGGPGYPPPRPPPRSNTGVIVAAVVGGFLVLFLIAGALGARKGASSTAGASERTARVAPAIPPASPGPVERPIEVDAKTLFDEYQQNEVAADDRYKGKKLLVRGTVQSVDKDFLDDIIVRLATSNQFMGAMAKMDDGEKSQAARLKKGERIAVLCEGRGIVIGTPSLHDCTFAR